MIKKIKGKKKEIYEIGELKKTISIDIFAELAQELIERRKKGFEDLERLKEKSQKTLQGY